jgi:hypothetical protein
LGSSTSDLLPSPSFAWIELHGATGSLGWLRTAAMKGRSEAPGSILRRREVVRLGRLGRSRILVLGRAGIGGGAGANAERQLHLPIDDNWISPQLR